MDYRPSTRRLLIDSRLDSGMMNAGSDRPGGSVPPSMSTGRWAATWILRKVVETTSVAATAGELGDAVATYSSDAGGACDPGCIFVWARPLQHNGNGHDGGMIYEGDRLGGSVRLVDAAPPFVPELMMATNHFLQTGLPAAPDPTQRYPGALTCCDGCDCSFSSTYRYMAGAQFVGQLWRDNQTVDARVAQEWLARVAHATTEHSVITHPAARKFGVLVADGSDLWDAPFRRGIDWVDVPSILTEARAGGTGSQAAETLPPPPREDRRNATRWYVHKFTRATSDPKAAADFMMQHVGAQQGYANHHECGSIWGVSWPQFATPEHPDGLVAHFVFNPNKRPGDALYNATELGKLVETVRGGFGKDGQLDQYVDDHIGLVVPSLDPFVRSWRGAWRDAVEATIWRQRGWLAHAPILLLLHRLTRVPCVCAHLLCACRREAAIHLPYVVLRTGHATVGGGRVPGIQPEPDQRL